MKASRRLYDQLSVVARHLLLEAKALGGGRRGGRAGADIDEVEARGELKLLDAFPAEPGLALDRGEQAEKLRWGIRAIRLKRQRDSFMRSGGAARCCDRNLVE